MESTVRNTKENAAELVDKIADKVKTAAADIADQAQDVSSSAAFGARTLVKAYPFASLCGALSVGALFGFALSRVIR